MKNKNAYSDTEKLELIRHAIENMREQILSIKQKKWFYKKDGDEEKFRDYLISRVLVEKNASKM